MDITDDLPIDFAADDTDLTPLVALFIVLPTVLGAAHHVDHVVRGNHVGWPLTPEVNPFTYSLAIYPLVAVSLYLTVTDRVDAGYLAGFSPSVLACSRTSTSARGPSNRRGTSWDRTGTHCWVTSRSQSCSRSSRRSFSGRRTPPYCGTGDGRDCQWPKLSASTPIP